MRVDIYVKNSSAEYFDAVLKKKKFIVNVQKLFRIDEKRKNGIAGSMNLGPIRTTRCSHSRHVMHTDVQFYTITSHKLQQKVHVTQARIAYNNQLIITVRDIIITHHPRKLARARSLSYFI